MRTRWWAVCVVLSAGALITVPGCGKKSSGDGTAAQGQPPAKADDRGGGASAGGSATDIPECAAHFKRIADCGEAESLVTKRKDEIQKKLDKGTSRNILAESCKTLDKVYKCKGDKGASAGDKKDEDPKAADPAKKDDKGASSEGELGIQICDDYVKTVKSCPATKSTKPLDTLVEKWRKALDDGKKKDVEEACERATKLFKCKG